MKGRYPGSIGMLNKFIQQKDFFHKSKWHIDNKIKYYPRDKSEFIDLNNLADKFVFDGYIPKTPIFKSDDKIIALGSCFARRMQEWLVAHNKSVKYIDVPDQLNNTFALRQYFEWILTGNTSTDAYWYIDSENGAKQWHSDIDRETLFDVFKQLNGFIITLGTSEVWRDIETGNVFWRGIPEDIFDHNKHIVTRSTVEENVTNLKYISSLIKEYLGENIKLILTLSPVPLNATFTGEPCIVADCVSKSILRVAISEFFETPDENIYYWPSFEMVRWVGSHLDIPVLMEDNSSRHVNSEIVKLNINKFIEGYFEI